MVYLPYSDDLRQPEADLSFTGASHPKADEHQVQAAERLMNSLNLQQFASSSIPNPTLQRHYQASAQRMTYVIAPFLVGPRTTCTTCASAL